MMSKSGLTPEDQETDQKSKDPAFRLQMELLIRLKKQQYMSVSWTWLIKFKY